MPRTAPLADPSVAQLVRVLEAGPDGGMRVGLATLAVLAPGAIALPAITGAATGPIAGVLVAVAVVTCCVGIVRLRDLFAEPGTAAPVDVEALLVERAEHRLREVSSPAAMVLMACAVGLVIVTTAVVGVGATTAAAAWLIGLGAAVAALMLGNLVWVWWIEVPRLHRALDRLRAPAR